MVSVFASLGRMTAGATVLALAVAAAMGPSTVRFLAAEVPRAYEGLLEWLTPLYLYLFVNGIILSLAAASRFQKSPPAPAVVLRRDEPQQAVQAAYRMDLCEPVHTEAVYSDAVSAPAEIVLYGHRREVAAVDVEEEKREVNVEEKVAGGGDDDEDFVIARSSWEPRRHRETAVEAIEYPTAAAAAAVVMEEEEKPLVSTRFIHRRISKPSPEGKTLGVARPRRHETLESTWRTITDGRPVPLARHLKKSDTWNHAARSTAAAPPLVKKSETFKEGHAVSAPEMGSSPNTGAGGVRLRREPSVGQDELNKRVEAFINKFNEEMRLQRQQSLQQYFEMINRGHAR